MNKLLDILTGIAMLLFFWWPKKTPHRDEHDDAGV